MNYKLYENKVAGHENIQTASKNKSDDPENEGDGEIILKPFNKKELMFYQKINEIYLDLKPYTATFYGTLKKATEEQQKLLINNSESRNNVNVSQSQELEEFICLENLTYRFKKPNIIDIKIGFQHYEDEESDQRKIQKARLKSENTTTKQLGLRISGMKIYNSQGDSELYDKKYGQSLKEETFMDAIKLYLSNTDKKNLKTLIQGFTSQLIELQESLKEKSFRLRSSSLLLIYETDNNNFDYLFNNLLNSVNSGSNSEEELGEPWDVRLIDFVHSHWIDKNSIDPDDDIIKSIDNLIKVFESI